MIFFFVFFRIARAWNQGGVKWAHIPSVREWLVHPNQQFMLFFLLVASFVYIGDSYRRLLVQHGRIHMHKSKQSPLFFLRIRSREKKNIFFCPGSHSLLFSLYSLAAFTAFLYKVNQLTSFRVAFGSFYGGEVPEILLARFVYLALGSSVALGAFKSAQILSRATEAAAAKAGLILLQVESK